ncbi:MAG: hypothetical protein J1E61_01125 [Lachnospiraceae bacterium]|nr:hypothetical protein [Lachnospiraceae bacterium]
MKRTNERKVWLFKVLFCAALAAALVWNGNCSRVFAAEVQLAAGEAADNTGNTDNTDNTGNVVIEEPTPISTNEFIMVGGNWVTPVATYGRTVNVVLPLVNMSTTNLNNVIVTPVIASDTADWPFEIQTSGYTQTIPDLPGKGNGQSDMDRRRELTWTFQVRGDVLNGYYQVPFNVIYYANGGYETTTVVTWVKAVGAPGSGNLSDGGSGLSTPRVIITGFDTVPANVYAGDTFTLTLHLKNTSKRTAVSNMQIDLSTPTTGTSQESSYEAFLPTSGSNTLYVESISPNGTADISIEMTAKADLSQKPYAITVNMDYEDSKYSPYSATANVSIPVNQEPRFDIGTMEVLPSDIPVGGQSNVMFSIFNTGKVTLNNVQVKFEGDSISGGDTFIGKIEPGATGNVDAMVSGEMATMDEGMVKAVVYYENDAGDTFTREEEFYLYVYEEFYEDDMMFDGDMMFEEEKGNSPVLIIVILVIIFVIAAIVTTVIILKKKKKKRELLELEAELEEEASGSEGNDEV